MVGCRAVSRGLRGRTGPPHRWDLGKGSRFHPILCLPPFLPYLVPSVLSHLLGLSVSAHVSVPLPLLPAAEKAKSHLEVPLEENVNRRVLEEGSVEARTIEDAIAVLRYPAEPRPWGRGLNLGWG